MSLDRLLVDLWMGLIMIAVVAVIFICLAWMLLGALTIAGGRRRARRPRRPVPGIEPLAGAYPEAELADIDAALEAILAQEQPRSGSRRR